MPFLAGAAPAAGKAASLAGAGSRTIPSGRPVPSVPRAPAILGYRSSERREVASWRAGGRETGARGRLV
ncbi:hypothetical protein GCM10018952_45540 [Streptosporangium vulgare]